VSRFESVRYLYAESQRRFDRQWFAGDLLFKRLSLHEFHDDEGFSLILTEVVDRADVGMVQGRCRPGLARETFESFTTG